MQSLDGIQVSKDHLVISFYDLQFTYHRFIAYHWRFSNLDARMQIATKLYDGIVDMTQKEDLDVEGITTPNDYCLLFLHFASLPSPGPLLFYWAKNCDFHRKESNRDRFNTLR